LAGKGHDCRRSGALQSSEAAVQSFTAWRLKSCPSPKLCLRVEALYFPKLLESENQSQGWFGHMPPPSDLVAAKKSDRLRRNLRHCLFIRFLTEAFCATGAHKKGPLGRAAFAGDAKKLLQLRGWGDTSLDFRRLAPEA